METETVEMKVNGQRIFVEGVPDGRGSDVWSDLDRWLLMQDVQSGSKVADDLWDLITPDTVVCVWRETPWDREGERVQTVEALMRAIREAQRWTTSMPSRPWSSVRCAAHR